MNLGDLIDELEKRDPKAVAKKGFHNPHSYRGDYYELAFEETGEITIGDMLEAARSAVGATYQGWKGGEFRMDRHSWCWLSGEGCTSGETISARLLGYILDEAEGRK